MDEKPERRANTLIVSVVGLALFGVAVVLTWAVADRVGDPARGVLLIETETDPGGSLLVFEDGQAEAGDFFADRDTARIVTRRSMTLRDLIRLYHLDNNPGALSALEEALGTSDPLALIPEGTEITVPVTPARPDR